MRYPGTIIIEILKPVPAGLPRKQAGQLIQDRIETACTRLIAEAGSCREAAAAASARV